MSHEETTKENVDKILYRLEKAIGTCNDLDIVDSVFHLGGYGKQLTEEHFDKLNSLYGLFLDECECKKR